MAVANTKSTVITALDNTPPLEVSPFLKGGREYQDVATVEVAAADDDTSVYRLFRIRSSDRISSILLANDVITGGTSFDLGVYQNAANGGAVLSVSLFADAVDLSSAHGFTDNTYEKTATNIDKVEKRLWELLGLSADPGVSYDICLTANTVGSGAGTISARMNYSKGI